MHYKLSKNVYICLHINANLSCIDYICNQHLFIASVALILFRKLIFFYKQDATGNFAIEWIST